jgi:hypothetical protein
MYENVWRAGEMIDGDPETFRELNNEQGRENIGIADKILYFAFMNHPSGGKSWASAVIQPSSGRPYVISYWGSDRHTRFTGSSRKEFSTVDAAKKEVLSKIKSKSTTSHGYVMTKGSMSAKKHLSSNGVLSNRNSAWQQKTGIGDGLFVFRSPERPDKDYCNVNL